MNPNLEAALAYAEKGLAIFPCKGKIPATKAGFKDATSDIEQVTQWWTEHPTWNIGCPIPEGYIVIDVDMKNGGFASLAALEEEGYLLPETRTAYTGGGGLHLWFAYAGNDLRQGAGILGAGIDTRVPGKGYVVMPPSIHPDTTQAYEWADRQPFVDLPEWMAEKLRIENPRTGRSWDEFKADLDLDFDEADKAHAITRVLGMAEKMEGAPEGTRNPLLNNLAYSAGRLIHYGIPHDWAFGVLGDAAATAGLPDDEIDATLNSGLRAGFDAGPDPEHHAPTVPHPIILPNTTTNLKVAETITRNPKAVQSLPDASVVQLMNTEFEELRWTVEDLVPEGLTLLCGTTKVGKSFLSLLMALKVAAGKPFLGLDTSGGEVLYIHLEDGDRRMQKRLRDFGADDLPHMDRFFHYKDWPTWGNGGLEQLEQWMTDHPDTQLVVIDTVGKLRPPGSGKDPYAADYMLYGGLQTWAVEKRVALVGVHHTNKSVSKDHQDRISGTRGVAGAADTTLMLDRIEGTKDGRLASVGRDGPQLDLALQFGENGLWTNEGEFWQWKIQSEHSGVLAAIRAAGGAATLEEIVQAVGGSKTAVQNRLSRMLTKGAITRPKYGTYGLPAFAQTPDDTLGI